MKFQYLGTAAYEGIPAFFCNCENCMKQILEEKKEMHKWDEESYEIIYVSIFGHDNLKMVI